MTKELRTSREQTTGESSQSGLEESGSANEGLLAVGTVLKPHGLKGGLKVKTFDPESNSLTRINSVTVVKPSGRRSFRVRAARRDRRWFIVFLGEIETRQQAEAFKGADLWVARGQLPELEADEIYLADCMNCKVFDVHGGCLGKVTGVIEAGPHALLEIHSADRQYLLPAGPPFLVDVEPQQSRIVVEIPAGLPSTSLPK